ncbi:heme-binding domain-containing protein [Dyadobacter subterraneus]|uniref:Heme-binding domain-containing protein n=1 Tax=Dyadobacter subterraneus TaxID=2773304 RepID=A0ABR9WBN4_9BACT|nr:heme-binding domain-containing protein [Dyadobacter subterraneus]MBE9462391.1 heme-binding domain-containing protein [Dyadobacter subterraneus]
MHSQNFVTKHKFLITGVLLAAVIGIQFVRPGIENPPVTENIIAPHDVQVILKKACYDCHSNETQLLWFDKIAPASWMVAKDVKDARHVLNFSHWDSLAPGDQKAKLFEAFNQISLGAMPLKQYAALHREAKLSAAEILILKSYITSLVSFKTSDTSLVNAANHQYDEWTGTKSAKVKPAPNGIEYIPDFKNWKAISTSDRFDNGTMRVIVANDIAVKAIKENHINPWPNGATFAKIAWDELIDSTGKVQTGAFKQVEFMIKDDNKYQKTAGWGWARWKGMQLTPYGKNETFTQECINCHRPVKDNDFVFTMPLHLQPK